MLNTSKPVLAVALTAGLAIGAASIASGESQAEETVVVEMTQQMTFEPETVTIQAGDTVEWRNPSSLPHTATFDPTKAADADNVILPEGAEPFDSGTLSTGESWSHTFEVAGRYQYVCLPHEMAGMIGEVIVEE